MYFGWFGENTYTNTHIKTQAKAYTYVMAKNNFSNSFNSIPDIVLP